MSDPFEVIDARFRPYTIPIVWLERLHTGMRWAEGPVYFADLRCLIWSDIPSNRMWRLDEESGAVSVFRAPSNFSNGNTRDREGRLLTCEHQTRRVTRTEHDGSITVIADRYDGKRLNAPNDVVVRSDGTVWFTDPTYGISAEYEGGKAESEIGACNVYRFDSRDGSLRIVADDFKRPNGLAFSPDERVLYINDSRHGHIRAFDIAPSGTLAKWTDRVFAELKGEEPGIPDGMKVDSAGNVFCGGAGGIWIMAPSGKKLGRIVHGSNATTNMAFGGDDWKTLYFTTHHELGSVTVNIPGVPVPAPPR
jgi:gluconolactonase